MKQHDKNQAKEIRSAAKSLSEAFLALQSPGEVKLFLEDLCTPAEIEALVDRWRVAQLLQDGVVARPAHAVIGLLFRRILQVLGIAARLPQ